MKESANNKKPWVTQATVAQERLEEYLEDTLKGEEPEAVWEFYTFLLAQSKMHKVDRSGYISLKQQDDMAEAKVRNDAVQGGMYEN